MRVKEKTFISYSAILAAVILTLTAVYAESKKFEGKGAAPIEGYDIRTARTLALKRAMRSAIEEAAGSLINPKVFTKKYDMLNEKVFKHPKKFVTDTIPLSEARKGDMYEVVVWADVDMGALRAALVKLGLLPPPEKVPRWLVFVPESFNGGAPVSIWAQAGSSRSTVESETETVILKYGYHMVRAGKNDALDQEVIDRPVERTATILELAKRLGATHALIGKSSVFSGIGIKNKAYRLGTAKVRLTAYNVESGEIVGETGARAAIEVPDGDKLEEKVLRAACGKLRGELVGWMHSVNPTGAAGFDEAILRLHGFTSYPEYASLIEAVEGKIPGVRKVRLISMSEGFAEVEVRYAGDGGELVRKIVGLEFKLFRLKLQGETSGGYSIKVIPTPH